MLCVKFEAQLKSRTGSGILGRMKPTEFSPYVGPSSASGAVSFSYDGNSGLRIEVSGLEEEVIVYGASDTHLALHDGRDNKHAGNYARMAQWPGSTDGFAEMLSAAKHAKADLVALTGDTISFPSHANVEFVSRALRENEIDWVYTAGNHDWHFEGVAGSDVQQRAKWTQLRLLPLYPGKVDPLMYSKVVKGVRFVAIDNSVYHIAKKQLAFWRREAAKGDPTVLLMHVPLWVEGFGIYTCGNPSWGADSDEIWQIERRERWAPRQSPESFALREAVLNTPNVVAVITGHIHRPLFACERGKFLFSMPSSAGGRHWTLRLVPAGRS